MATERFDLKPLLPEDAPLLAELGADESVLAETRQAETAARVLELAQEAGLPLADVIAERAREVAEEQLAGRAAVEVVLFGRKGEILGRSPS